MICIKCGAEIPEGSLYCNLCGKKQVSTVRKSRTHKRATGTGTITKDKRYKNRPYIVRAPSTSSGMGRVYIGAFADMKSAQAALEEYIRNGRSKLYKATLSDIYDLWSAAHFETIKEDGVKLYTYMWKRFEPIKDIKMVDIKTAHFQQIVNGCTSKSAAQTVRAMASMMCKYAMENDLITKNYADFIKIPKFERNEKLIFTDEQIAVLWDHTNDKRVQAILSMIYMGFRIGELLMIKPADVFFDDGYVVTGEKTDAGKKRVIPFPPMIPEIKDFFESWCKGVSEDRPIWNMTSDQFRNTVFYNCLLELGLIDGEYKNNKYVFSGKHLTPHSTRHTFGSLSARAGMRPDSLQKIIGHASYKVTADIYIHKNVDELKSAMSALKKPADTLNDTTKKCE